MRYFERRMVFGGLALLLLALSLWIPSTNSFGAPAPRTAASCPHAPGPECYTLAYYGADLPNGMKAATGVDENNPGQVSGPWPQRAGNYCFIANVQAIVNYANWNMNHAIPYPTNWYQGPPPYDGKAGNGNPYDEQSGQILSDMDHSMQANFPPGPTIYNQSGTSWQFRRPFTLADSSHDFGGDPRAIAYATWYETPTNH